MSTCYFYKSFADPSVQYFHGATKYENEELIKWGWPEDIWFHVDGFSSAHVYLRLSIGSQVNLDEIPKAIVEECGQLTKFNSISGSKERSVKVCYTPWSNLLKKPGMDVGSVSFKSQKQVKYIQIEKKNDIIKVLNRTKLERNVNVEAERADRDAEEKSQKRQASKELKKIQIENELKAKEARDLKNYASFKASKNDDDDDDNDGFWGEDDDGSDDGGELQDADLYMF